MTINLVDVLKIKEDTLREMEDILNKQLRLIDDVQNDDISIEDFYRIYSKFEDLKESLKGINEATSLIIEIAQFE